MAASNKNIEELLNYYVDRELSSAEEEQLFAQLAESDTLRSELKHMQMLRSETRNYLSAMTPPAALTSGVFAKLGFTGSAAAAASEIAREGATIAASLPATTASTIVTIQNLWLPISAAVISATITTVALFAILTSSNKPVQIISDPVQPQEIEQTQPPKPAVPADTAEPAGGRTSAGSGLVLPHPARIQDQLSSTQPETAAGGTTASSQAPATKPESSLSRNAAPSQAPPTTNPDRYSPATGKTTAETLDKTAQTRSGSEPVRTLVAKPAIAIAAPTASVSGTPVSGAPATGAPVSGGVQQKETHGKSEITKPVPAFPGIAEAAARETKIVSRDASAITAKEDVSKDVLLSEHNRPSDILITTLPPYRVPIALAPGVSVHNAPVPQSGEDLYLPFDDHSAPSPFSVSLRYIDPIALKGYSTGIKEASLASSFENMAAGFNYALSKNSIIGVEIGQEAFAQNYNGIIWIDQTRGGETLKVPKEGDIYQHYMTSWGTLNYTQQFGGLFGIDAIKPFASLGVGWTYERWFLTRPSAGLYVYISGNIAVRGGLESTMLFYNYDHTTFTTRKFGVTGGLWIQF